VVQLEQQLVKFMRRDWRKNWLTTEKIKLIVVEHRIARFGYFFSFFIPFFGIDCRKFFCKFAKCSTEKEFWGAGSWGLSIQIFVFGTCVGWLDFFDWHFLRISLIFWCLLNSMKNFSWLLFECLSEEYYHFCTSSYVYYYLTTPSTIKVLKKWPQRPVSPHSYHLFLLILNSFWFRMFLILQCPRDTFLSKAL